MISELLAGNRKIAIVGLGYVGLPLALAFAKRVPVIGFDIDEELISQLKEKKDPRNEVASSEFENIQIEFSSDESRLSEASIYIVAVPTPVTNLKQPDLRPLLSASKSVGKNMNAGSIVIYESTVYPGCTEEDCLPIIEELSSLKHGKDFYLGYSPERINPGDKVHTLKNTVKIVSGDSPETLKIISELYKLVVDEVHEAPTIKVAEAAKIVENTQRDLNIALMNELSIMFDLMDVNTMDVIKAAGTKWNFMKFYPGLVGGHCIGVDPYYLTYRSQQLGYSPEIILAGRKVNDNLSRHVVSKILKFLKSKKISISQAKVLVLGVTFKENVSDIRNSRVIDVIKELHQNNIQVDVYDSYVDTDILSEEYGLQTTETLNTSYNVAIAAVKHVEFLQWDEDRFANLLSKDGLFVDIKSAFRHKIKDVNYWAL